MKKAIINKSESIKFESSLHAGATPSQIQVIIHFKFNNIIICCKELQQL